jgi:hypothetical protein
MKRVTARMMRLALRHISSAAECAPRGKQSEPVE